MKRGGIKLLAILLAAAAAWNLGSLAAALSAKSQQARVLEQAIEGAQRENSALEAQRAELQTDEAMMEQLRRQGYIAAGDLVFFDGGAWCGKAGAALENAQK